MLQEQILAPHKTLNCKNGDKKSRLSRAQVLLDKICKLQRVSDTNPQNTRNLLSVLRGE